MALSLPLQILVYEGEMERAQGQLEAEMQNLEEEKNRVIEEAFIRAESEMKAVHENLAGEMLPPAGLVCVPLCFCVCWASAECVCLSRGASEPAEPAAGPQDAHQRLQLPEEAGAGLPLHAGEGHH